MIVLLPMLSKAKILTQWLLVSIFPIIIMTGCGGKVILSDDAVRIRRITEFVHELKGLYEQRDLQILSMFSPEYLETERGLRGAILNDVESFNSISLRLFIDRIEISDDKVSITIHWDGVWKDAMPHRKGGSMVLLTSYGDSIKITGVRGESFFGISSEQRTMKINHTGHRGDTENTENNIIFSFVHSGLFSAFSVV